MNDNLAPFACRSETSRGRLVAEEESVTRTIFQRDRDRVIHSSAFRRLMHKTQVFVYHEGDYFRTRLTHSLEVAQIARSIARGLRLDEDLAEALALAHDLGHPPFGHAGEDALQACMEPYGGFDHNAQSLRTLTDIEKRYANFDGLNLSWETLEGVVKHNGPLLKRADDDGADLPEGLRNYRRVWDLEMHTFASAEAQVAALSDDIAYNNHDLDDGLRAGLFDFDDLDDLPMVGEILGKVRALYPDLGGKRLRHETIRRLITHMIDDLMGESQKRIADLDPRSPEDVRGASMAIIAFSDNLKSDDVAVRSFLHENMYRHYRVNRMTAEARRVVTDLFGLFLDEPEVMPEDWQVLHRAALAEKAPRVICDYIAGMTDRFALLEHKRLFQLNP